MLTTKHNWGLFIVGLGVFAMGIIMLFTPLFDWFVAMIVFAGLMGIIGVTDIASYAVFHKQLEWHKIPLINAFCDLAMCGIFLLALLFPFGQLGAAPVFAGVFMIAYGVWQLFSTVGFGGLYKGAPTVAFMGAVAIICGFFMVVVPEIMGFFMAAYMICRGLAMLVGGMAVEAEELPKNVHPYGA